MSSIQSEMAGSGANSFRARHAYKSTFRIWRDFENKRNTRFSILGKLSRRAFWAMDNKRNLNHRYVVLGDHGESCVERVPITAQQLLEIFNSGFSADPFLVEGLALLIRLYAMSRYVVFGIVIIP